MVELYKRDKSPYWYAFLHDPKAPSGYRRVSTKETSKGKAREVARDLQAEIDREQASSEKSEHHGLTWSQASAVYIETAALAPKTIVNHTSMAEIILRSCLGDFYLNELTEDLIHDFVNERRRTLVRPHNRKEGGGTRRVSDATIRHYLNLMSATYKHVMRQKVEGAPERNPFDTFDRQFLGNTVIVDRQLKPDQFQQILDLLTDPELQAMVITLAGTGLRTGELLSLTWPQVDFVHEYLRLGYLEDERTKTQRARDVPMEAIVYRTLSAHKSTLISKGDFDPQGWVFPSRHRDKDGRRSLRRNDLSYVIKIVKERLGITKYTNHRLRHSFASWMLQKGVDPISIRDLLGHATLSTTSRYARQVTDTLADKVRKIGLISTTHSTTHSISVKADKSKKPKRTK